MSSSALGRLLEEAPETANIFAALGDPTRLGLVTRLSNGSQCSISQLAENSTLTRQAITKHLRVLEDAGVVSSRKSGRENLYALNPQRLHDATAYMDVVSRQWDQALGRLKSFVES
ncbi:ArsR/SmtB family transcription factor [Dokdonella sp.]|uniref:ArsR/SmtB family transcription factor n=1 Tax=Dokdonella sp. TaxID=2291710 RepID=UPI003C472EC8